MGKLSGMIVPVTPFQQNCAILWDEASKAGMVVDPAKTAAIETAIRGVAADLAAPGVTEDELARAKNPILTAIRRG